MKLQLQFSREYFSEPFLNLYGKAESDLIMPFKTVL